MFNWSVFFKTVCIMLGAATLVTGVIGVLYSDRFIRRRIAATVIFAVCAGIGIAILSAGIAIRL